ncbi:MAG: hypothetical protein AAFQ87_27060 [Bacteroidota bacterium]
MLYCFAERLYLLMIHDLWSYQENRSAKQPNTTSSVHPASKHHEGTGKDWLYIRFLKFLR